ncbi:hypothetical protein [Prosthecobacter sp.]|uniref:hypothetical protein n=1 Tax=Prosthecobacter sp. TaxID=1965333 RepID=UPI00378344DF
MQKEAALAALRTIDVKVFASEYQDLTSEEVDQLKSACSTLISSMSDDHAATRKAASLVDLILATLEKPGLAKSTRGMILEQGISLSLYLQQLH